FNVVKDHTYNFSFCAGGGTATFNTQLDLYRGDCAWQVWNDDACGTLSQLPYTATATGTVYVRVKGRNPSDAGNFVLAYRDFSVPAACATECPSSDGEFTPAVTYQTVSDSVNTNCWKLYKFHLSSGVHYRFT